VISEGGANVPGANVRSCPRRRTRSIELPGSRASNHWWRTATVWLLISAGAQRYAALSSPGSSAVQLMRLSCRLLDEFVRSTALVSRLIYRPPWWARLSDRSCPSVRLFPPLSFELTSQDLHFLYVYGSWSYSWSEIKRQGYRPKSNRSNPPKRGKYITTVILSKLLNRFRPNFAKR